MFGLLGWCLLASLPYYEEIYIGGRDNEAVFHVTLALVVIAWLITIFTYAFRFAGCCTENKAVMQMIQVKGKYS